MAKYSRGEVHTMNFLIRWLLNGLALMAVAWFLPGVTVDTWGAAIFAGLALGLVNALLRPVLKVLTLPINIMTLGIFGLVLNAFLFWLVSEGVQGFSVTGPLYSLMGAVLTALLASVLSMIFGVKKR